MFYFITSLESSINSENKITSYIHILTNARSYNAEFVVVMAHPLHNTYGYYIVLEPGFVT